MITPTGPTSALGAEPAFVVQLDAFSGPLDLLLHLLREEQIDIADIPIARIADQFLKAIHDLGLNQAADYLEMAGRLLRLKAQMLLPRRDGEEGWEDPRHELVRRLLEYQLIREVANWLERSASTAGRAASAWLSAAAARVAASAADPRPDRAAQGGGEGRRGDPLAGPPPGGGPAAGHRGSHRAAGGAAGASGRSSAGSRRWDPVRRIVDVLSTLLSLLELARRGIISLAQSEAFQSFVIRRERSPDESIDPIVEAADAAQAPHSAD